MKTRLGGAVGLICLLASASLLSAASDPDFSGTWHLDLPASEIHTLPSIPWSDMVVEHKGTDVKCRPESHAAVAAPSGLPFVLQFATTGKESKHSMGEGTGKSIAKWEGSALLINTLVSEKGMNYTQMDRWKISRDGEKLVIVRTIVSSRGESESTLVYTRSHSAAH